MPKIEPWPLSDIKCLFISVWHFITNQTTKNLKMHFFMTVINEYDI